MRAIAAGMVLVALAVSGAAAEDATTRSGRLLSAFFGLDNSMRLRIRSIAACLGAAGRDGMPVVFSHEIDPTTLDADDFRVTTASGEIGRVRCATLRPADEPGELRTVLLVGEYGSAEDQPVRVEIVGDLSSLDGALNFLGADTTVVPLERGPTMILAEMVPQENWGLGEAGNCPSDGVMSVVRVTWTGGITKPGGDEIGAAEMALYRVVMRRADGSIETAAPLTVADLGDSDNNHELCIGVEGEPLSVYFPAGALTDPNEDLNPETEIEVSAGDA